jgi:ABC-type uncharacterized transport system permease subunit
MPRTGELVLLFIAVLLFTAGGVVSIARAWGERQDLRVIAKGCLVLGIACSIGVLIWHSAARSDWLPLVDNFDSLVWLAVLLAGFVLYVQRTRPLAGLEWFLMPVVVMLLLLAAYFGRREFHPYVHEGWSWVHRITTYGGAVAFAIAGALGAMYLVAMRRLRSKSMPPGPSLGSLERLEHLTYLAVTLGFALLSLGAVTGAVIMVREGRQTPTFKLLLALGVWLVYALVLHAPINPVFRGRRAALLSVVGFVLMVGAIVAVQVR